MSNSSPSFFSRHKNTFFALIFVFLYSVTISYATPPATKYQPGETLDPTCAPGNTNCSVQVYPDLTGNAGKVLSTDGTTLSWTTFAGLPTQTGHSGQFLTTDGTNASWVSFSSLFPSQSGHAGQALLTDGAGNFSWGLPAELFNASRNITRASLPGVGTTIATDGTLADFIDKYFFPAVFTAPGASLTLSSGAANRELGSSNAVAFNWTATKNTNTISTIVLSVNNGGTYLTGTPITATGNTQSGSATATSGSNTSTTATAFTLTVTAPGSGTTTATSTVNIQYFNKIYYGLSTVASGISDGQIQTGLTGGNSPGTLTASRAVTSTAFNPSSQYVYFVFPASFEPAGGCKSVDAGGTPTAGTTNCFFSGANPVSDFILESRSFTNASGYTSTYNIYRSQNLLTGSISYSVQ